MCPKLIKEIESRAEKTILAISNFPFYNNVFIVILPRSLNPFPNKPWLVCVCCMSLENNVRKGEIPRN